MADRWIAACRRLVPNDVREQAFDPSVADLLLAMRLRETASFGAHLRLRWGVWLVTCQCLWLVVLERLREMGQIRGGHVSRIGGGAIKRLWREPRFSVAVVLTLALGLGANLTVFTFVDAFFLAPLAVPDADRLVRVGQDSGTGEMDVIDYPTLVDSRAAVAGVLDLAGHTQTTALVGPTDAAQEQVVELVTGNYFRVMGLRPQLGRLIDDQDDAVELAQPVAVVSDQFWRSHLDGRATVLGESLVVNGSPFVIIGVGPRGFSGTYAARQVEVWTPTAMQQVVRPRGLPRDRRTWGWLSMVARQAPGVTLEGATRALTVAADEINRRFPPRSDAQPFGLRLAPLTALSVADARQLSPVLMTAFAFTGLLLLATCANVTALMHNRLVTRRRELAIRQSLGAGRVRLSWEWLMECLVLALCGGVVSLGLARLAAAALASADLPGQVMGDLSLATALQWRVVGYTVAASVGSAILFGLGTAWRAGRQLPAGVLRSDATHATSNRRTVRARRLMVVVQVCVSVVLLTVASLLDTSLQHQEVADTGFAADELGLLSVDLRRQRIPESDWPGVTADLLAVVRRVPGVSSADVGMSAPLSGDADSMGLSVPGYDAPGGEPVRVAFNQVGPQYFKTMGLAFTRGRPWDAGPPNQIGVVINTTMANRFWPGVDPVGRTIRLGSTEVPVLGVVADSAYYNLGELPRPFLYVPAHVQAPGRVVIHIRAAAGLDPRVVASDAARAIAAADARVMPFDVMSFNDLRRVPMFPTRMMALAASVFSVLSLLLTIVGLYGVIASSVAARSGEIGIRMALGAAPDAVQRSVIGDALGLAAIGAGAGIALGILAGYQLRGWLFHVAPFDPSSTALALVVIAIGVVLSAWIPARRAARVDAVAALRG